MDERLLIKQLIDPETKERAFFYLIQQYKERLYWQIRRMVYRHEDADDLVQETFIKIYKGIGLFHGDSKLYTWMYRIAINEALSFLNRVAKEKGVSLESIQMDRAINLQADSFFDGDEALLKLQQAIATLPEQQKRVFQLRYFDEMTYKEMAELLQLTEGTLKANYHHAKKKVEDFLNDD